jgi:hypothetical protein
MWKSDRPVFVQVGRRVVVPAGAALLALTLASSCGGGGGGSGSEPLAGNEAIEASLGNVVSTGEALQALLLDVELSVAAVMVESAGGEGAGSGEAPSPCSMGGTVQVSCQVDVRGRTKADLRFSDCRSLNDFGQTRMQNGAVSVDVLDPTVCVTGVLREDIPFNLRFDGFRSEVSDGDHTLGVLTADLTEGVVLHGGGCLAQNGRRDVDGALGLQLAAGGVDFSATASGLTLDVTSQGAPCTQRVTADGGLDIDDHAAGSKSSQTLNGVEIELREDAGDVLLSFGGDVQSDCLGTAHFETTAPARLPQGVGCPVDGGFLVTLADATIGSVGFVGGGVEIDFGADDSVDETVDDCRSPSLAVCR